MFFSLLSIFTQVLSTVLALGLSAFVLSRNWRAWVNRWLALGLLVIASIRDPAGR